MTINRKSSSKREAIARIELIREATKLRSEVQYLVTLKMRNSRTHRSTETPRGGITSVKKSCKQNVKQFQ